MGIEDTMNGETPAAERLSVEQIRAVAAEAVWLARLARSSSWPLDMAQQVEMAGERVATTAPVLAERVIAAEAEVEQWKANHADVVRRKRRAQAEVERLRALERAVDSLFDGLVHSMADLFALYKEADGWDEVLALAVDEIRESRQRELLAQARREARTLEEQVAQDLGLSREEAEELGIVDAIGDEEERNGG